MRELKFDTPIKIKKTEVKKENIYSPAPVNYSRCLSVLTTFGIVIVEELKWETNFGFDEFTILSTMIGDMRYSAQLNEAKLSDRQIKWLATNFIKRVLNQWLEKERTSLRNNS